MNIHPDYLKLIKQYIQMKNLVFENTRIISTFEHKLIKNKIIRKYKDGGIDILAEWKFDSEIPTILLPRIKQMQEKLDLTPVSTFVETSDLDDNLFIINESV